MNAAIFFIVLTLLALIVVKFWLDGPVTLYWEICSPRRPSKYEKFRPSKELKKIARKHRADIVLDSSGTFYVVKCTREPKKGDLVLLVNTHNEVHVTRCMTYDKHGTFPPVFRDNSTLIEHDIVGVVVKVIGNNTEEQIIEELDL